MEPVISPRSACLSKKEAPWASVNSAQWENLLHNWVSVTASFRPLFSHVPFHCIVFLLLVSPPSRLHLHALHPPTCTVGLWSRHKVHLGNTYWFEEQTLSLQGKTLCPNRISLKTQNGASWLTVFSDILRGELSQRILTKSTTFFFNLIFISYWSIVDLQCYVSFRCTAKWFSYTYTYIHSFKNSFPI